MEERRFVVLSVLLALVWGGTALAWLLHAAKDRARRVSTLVMLGFALAFGPLAFSKNGGDPPLRSGASAPSAPSVSLLLAEVRTNAVFDLSMPSNAVVHGPWLRRGASDDWFWLHATNALFRAGTNAFRSVRVSSRGMLAFPDGSRLEPFHAVLGVLPEPNWTNAPSRVWQAPAAGGGRLFTWEGAALDRDPATPVSFQAELRRDGGVVGRYDLPHPATNFAIAAFGETALAVRGGVTNAATVRRVDGAAIPETSLAEILRDATRFELVWRAAEGDPDDDPDGDGLTTRDEIGRHGTDPKQPDTDGDGLSDAAELLLGSNPLDADENGDGVPDGIDPVDWAANVLWPTNETGNIIVSLVEAIPTNMAATFQIGDLSIPLRDPDTWTFSLEPGVAYAYRLFVADGATANLAITNDVPGPPMRGATSWGRPLWDEGTGGVFDGPSFGGKGEMAIPVLSLLWEDPQDGSHRTGTDICLHGGTEARFSKSLLPLIADSWILDNLTETGDALILSVPRAGESFEGRVELDPAALRFGSVYATVSAHRCDASYDSPFCSICGHYEPEDCTLNVSRQILTLKHDNQAYLSVLHPNSPNVSVSGSTIQIRRQNESTWYDLGMLSNLSPWTARVAGHFELRALSTADGRTVTSGVATVEVRFPDCYDISCDPDFIAAADMEWNATLDDCTDVPNRRREHGFWILLNTESNRYEFGETKLGDWATPTTNASVRPLPRPIDFPSNPTPISPGLFYVVGWFHTHTAYVYMPTNMYRRVGPSPDDYSNNLSRQVASIVYDFIGSFDPDNPTNRLEAGHLKSDPKQFYFVPPERRPTPSVPTP